MAQTSRFDRVVERRGTNTYKWDLKATNSAGRDIVPMWVADMDFVCAEPILEALRDRVAHGVFGYTLVPDSYRGAFIEWQQRRHGWRVDPEHLVFVPGVMPAVRSAILALTEPGDEIVVQTPVYFPFFSSIADNGRKIVENPLVANRLGERAGRYEIDFDHLESVITPRTRAMILCSPHNPVGRVWTRSELERLAAIIERHDLIVISDEIHADIRRAGVAFVPFADLAPEVGARTIACHAPSKTFNIAGLPSAHIVISDAARRTTFEATAGRLGFGLADPLALVASEAAYARCESWVDELLSFLDARFAALAAALAELPVDESGEPLVSCTKPEGTYLGWLDFRALQARSGADDALVRRALFEESALWLSEGRQFGAAGAGFQRINIATPSATMDEGLARLRHAVEWIVESGGKR